MGIYLFFKKNYLKKYFLYGEENRFIWINTLYYTFMQHAMPQSLVVCAVS